MSLRLHSARTGGGRRRPPLFFTHRKPIGERYPHANTSGACARALKSDCPRRISRHAKSPENRECVLGDFLGESGFHPEPFFPSRPGQRGTREKENPRHFVSGDSGLVGAEGFEPSAFCSRTRVTDSRIPFIFNGFRTSAVRLAPVWVTFWVTYPIALAQTT